MAHSSSSFRLRPLSVAILTALFHNAAEAAPVSWVPDADGFWDVVTNWSSNPALPQSTDDVTLDVGGATVRTVTHRSGTNTVNSLTSQENFVLSGGSLSLLSASSIAAGYTQSGGTLGGTGNLTVTGAATLSGGVMTGAGRTIAQGATALTALNLDAGRVFENQGTVTWSAGTLDLNATGTTGVGQNENAVGGVFEATGNNVISSAAKAVSGDGNGASFVNAGTFRKKTGTGTTTVDVAFNNTGTVDVQSGMLSLNADVVQHAGNVLTSGTWKVSGNGILNLNEPGAINIATNQGDVTLDGATASFARINTLTTNQGAFRLLGNRNFTAGGAFINSGVLQLAGGTFAAPSLSNTGTGEIFGFGTITPSVLNSGLVRASGGTLTATGGIDGQSGTIQSDAGATLALGANSDADFLVNNGTLALGTANITVAQDYTNANFGSGNSFNARANVTGSGQILASGNVAQALTGEVSNGTGASPSMVFGNIHVGDVATKQFSIANTGGSGPALRGALQTSAGGGNLTDARLSGSGATAGNFGPVAVNSASAPLSVTLTGSSAGALADQRVAVVNNFDNIGEQVLGITGAVYRYANPTAHTPEPFNFGNRRVGDVTSQALSVTNNVAADGFSEALDASIGSATTGVTSNGGSFALLGAGATNTEGDPPALPGRQ